MGVLVANCGEIAHMSSGDASKPLVGAAMMDKETNVHPPGMGILMSDSSIVRIADSESLCSEFAPWWDGSDTTMGETRVLDAAGKAVIPGLIDSHTHLLWGGDRSSEMRLRQAGMSYRDIAEAGGGIAKTVRSTRGLSVDELTEIGISRVNQATRTGTTVMEAKSGYGLETESELRLLQAINDVNQYSNATILPTWLGAHDFPNRRSRDEYLGELLSEQIPAVAKQGIAMWTDVFCEEGWYSNEETEDIVRAAAEYGIPSRLHVDEFTDSGGLALAAELGAVSGDHAAKSSHESRQAAADIGTMQTFLPGTPLVLGLPMDAPLASCIENDWAFSIATDFNPNCRILSMPFIGSLITTRMGMDPFAALVAASRNPATTLDQPDVTGTIAQGSKADLSVIWSDSVDGWCQTPGENPISSTIIGGSIVNSNN